MDPNFYPKATGSAGSKGTHFQLNLVLTFLLSALRQNKRNWRLSTENKLAGKFDDAVLEMSDRSTILLQAKYKEHKKVSMEHLLSPNPKNDFSLPKYLLSYLEIMNMFSIKHLIICTNTQVDGDVSKFLKQNTVTKESFLYYKDGASFYTFNDSIVPALIANAKEFLKNNSKGIRVNETFITKENVKKFLNHLQLYLEYPSGSDLEKIMEILLSNKSVIKLLDRIPYLFLHQKLKDWFEQPRGEYLTEKRVRAMFCEIKSDQFLQLLQNYKVSFKNNNLENIIMHSQKTIFHIIAKEGLLMHLLKVYSNLYHIKNSKILCVGYKYSSNVQVETIKSFTLPQYNFLIIASDNFQDELLINEIYHVLNAILEKQQYKKIIFVADSCNKLALKMKSNHELKYYVFHESLDFENLSDDTKKMFLYKSVIFQGEATSFGELLSEQITDKQKMCIKSDVLENLLIAKEIEIGMRPKDLTEETSIYYLNRKFERIIGSKNENERADKNVTKWKEIVCEEDIHNITDKIIIISDSAGMGKTTVLKNLEMRIKKNNPLLWVFRIELNSCTNVLKSSLSSKRIVNILHLLNLDNLIQLTNKLDTFLFSLEQKVILMLDGADEINPDYTQLILDLIIQIEREGNFKKIFVTARPHMAEELEKHLNVTPFNLIPFTEENQIDFFTRYWSCCLKLDSAKINKCKQYARTLIRKVSFWIREWYTEEKFVASPLHAEILAEVFLQSDGLEDWEGCKEYLSSEEDEPKLPEFMNIANLYEKFINRKREIFVKKGNLTGNTTANKALIDKFEECLEYHNMLALEEIFGEIENWSFFDYYHKRVKHDLDVDAIVLKMGIVQKVYNQLIFIHRTFAEYFAAKAILKEIKLQNCNIDFQNFLIDEIFLYSRFKVIRKYLNNVLHNQISDLDSDMYSNYKLHYMSLVTKTYNYHLIHELAKERNYEIICLVLRLINFRFIRRDSKTAYMIDWIPHYKKLNTLNIIKYGGGIDIKYRGFTPLHEAVFRGDPQTVNFLLKMGADVNCRMDLSGGVPTIYCVPNGIFFNCYNKYDIDMGTVERKTTALHFAVAFNMPHIIDILLKYGADINITDSEGNTAVHFAVIKNDFHTFQLLLNHGGSVDVINKLGKTAFHFAAEVGSCKIIEFLVQQNVNINIPDYTGNTALQLVTQYRGSDQNDLDIVTFLMNHGCVINNANFKGVTALHFAVMRCNCQMIDLLLKYGANINAPNKNGDRPVHLAAIRGSTDVIDILMRNDHLDVNAQNKQGNAALHLIGDKHFDCHSSNYIASKLIEKGANINIANKYGNTPLHLAVRRGTIDFINLLMKNDDVCVNVQNMEGNTALHMVVDEFFDRPCNYIVCKLIERGANRNIANKKGNTPLHLAARWGKINIVNTLIGYGEVDINALNKEGNPPIYIALNDDTVFKLIEWGADVNIPNKNGDTLLHLAARWGNINIANFLTKSGRVDINVANKKGNTALHVAVDEYVCNIVPKLIDWGADGNICNKRGHTPLRIATKRGYNDIVTILKNKSHSIGDNVYAKK